jgi:hypothetical protein
MQKKTPPPSISCTDGELLHEIAKDISADRIEQDIRTLVSFGTRHALSETESETHGIGVARRWIKEEFDNISNEYGGCLEVFFQSKVISGESPPAPPVHLENSPNATENSY